MTACFQFSLSFSGYGQKSLQALIRTPSIEYRRLSDVMNAESNAPQQQQLQRQPKNFFKSPKIYQNAFLYVFARIFTTTALVYFPLWLDERLIQTSEFADIKTDSSVEHIALVPMVSFISSFLSSLLMNKSHHIFGHRVAYLLGSMTSICGCALVETSISLKLSNARLYSIAIIFGAGSSITMISSLCSIADMIGKHADQSGFVYSAVTFADKLITGIAILVIESM